LFRSLSPQGRSYWGLGMLTADGLFLLMAIFFILGGECWRFAPIFAPPVATDEAGALFDAYAKEAAENDKQFAAARKEDFAALANIAFPPKDPAPKQETILAVGRLAGAAWGREEGQAAINRGLVQGYREKYQEAFRRKNAETLQRATDRDGWILSVLGSILVLLVGGAIAWGGIRLLRSAAMPGTVFEMSSQAATSGEEGRIT
jgi:hypothetical protein